MSGWLNNLTLLRKHDIVNIEILNPLLFAIVMNVVSNEAISGLPSDLLYADELVRMAPTMEYLGRRVAKWRASLLDKGLNVNVGKSKIMVSSSGEKMIVNSPESDTDVSVGKEYMQTVQCAVCIRWIHQQYSGVRGDLSLVAGGFSCKRCDGTIQEADLAGDLLVDGETYGCVKSFCYL